MTVERMSEITAGNEFGTLGFVLGGMENQTYEEYTFILQKGCTLVVYTDGYPEAMDSKGEMFGKERLKEALNRMPDADPKTLSEHALKSVMNYVDEAEQFDDLTMLILRDYKLYLIIVLNKRTVPV